MTLLLSALLLAAGAAEAARRHSPADYFEAKRLAGDIVYSPKAARGARLTLISAPQRHAAGLAVPAAVAQVYSGDFPDAISHHQNGHDGQGEDKGQKTGHWDTDGGDDGEKGDARGHGGERGPGPDNGRRGDDDSHGRRSFDNELIRNNEFTHNLEHWEHRSAYVTDSFGPIRASELSEDGKFVAVHTGWSYTNDRGSIEQAITVPMARSAGLSMLYNFVTCEFPDWQGSQYNDFFKVTLSGPSGERTFSAAEFLNGTSFTAVSGLPAGIVDGWFPGDVPVNGGQTGWKVMSAGGLALKNGIYRLRVEVRDVGDSIVDSTILVDKMSLK